MPSHNRDDQHGFGHPERGATIGHEAQALTSASATQYPSRRDARGAASGSSRAQRRAVARSPRDDSGHGGEPRSHRLRRSDIRVMHAAAPQGQRPKPIRGLATMGVVVGLFACVALPAYAMVPTAPSEASASSSASQSMVVSADAAELSTTRDGYHATTAEQIAEASNDDVRAQNNADYLASGARALGDDYPWPYELSAAQGGGLSPLNYYYRECVDFVAWRLNRDAGSYAAPYKWVWSNLTPTGGNASQWKYAWDAKGWATSKTPIVGSVAWFGWSNHVAYVKAVNADGTVTLEEYNYIPGIYSQRTLPATDVESFLYPPS